jgi:hypothetical protein
MSRRVGAIIAIVSLAVLAASVLAMTRRVREFNERAEFPQYRIKPVTTRDLNVWDRPLRITDTTIEHAGRTIPAIRIEYAGQSVVTPIKPPPAPDLPKLVGYAEWLAVLQIKEYPPKTSVQESTTPASQRVAVVKRNPAEGYDPETWGQVRRADWTFDFYVLTPEGAIEHEQRRFPRSDLGERSLAARAKAAIDAGKPDDPDARLHAVAPLEERTWEYASALFVIPALQVPKYKFKDDAVGAMGWTLPAGMFSALAFTGGLVFAVARGRRAPQPAPLSAPPGAPVS